MTQTLFYGGPIHGQMTSDPRQSWEVVVPVIGLRPWWEDPDTITAAPAIGKARYFLNPNLATYFYKGMDWPQIPADRNPMPHIVPFKRLARWFKEEAF